MILTFLKHFGKMILYDFKKNITKKYKMNALEICINLLVNKICDREAASEIERAF